MGETRGEAEVLGVGVAQCEAEAEGVMEGMRREAMGDAVDEAVRVAAGAVMVGVGSVVEVGERLPPTRLELPAALAVAVAGRAVPVGELPPEREADGRAFVALGVGRGAWEADRVGEAVALGLGVPRGGVGVLEAEAEAAAERAGTALPAAAVPVELGEGAADAVAVRAHASVATTSCPHVLALLAARQAGAL